MLLETARRYNHETECITFLKDFTYSKDDFHRAGMVGRGLGGCRAVAPGERAGRVQGRCPCRASTGGRPEAISLLSEPLFFYLQSGVSQPQNEMKMYLLSAESVCWDAVRDETEGCVLSQWGILIGIKKSHSLLPKPGVTGGRPDLSSL